MRAGSIRAYSASTGSPVIQVLAVPTYSSGTMTTAVFETSLPVPEVVGISSLGFEGGSGFVLGAR